MRASVAAMMLCLLSAAPALAQTATTAAEPGRKAHGWENGTDDVLQARAGIRLPQQVNGYSLTSVRMLDDHGFDSVAKYQRGGDFLTVFLYQPIDNAIRLQWAAAAEGMSMRFSTSDRTGEAAGHAVPGGTVSVLTYAGGPEEARTSDALAMGRLGNGWIAKARITAEATRAEILEDSLSLFRAIGLPGGQRLHAPPTDPIPACAPLILPKTPAVRKPISGDLRTAITLAAVVPLTSVGTVDDDRHWCRSGKTSIGSMPAILYRAQLEGGHEYRAPLGDNGSMLRLEKATLGKEPGDWWLVFDRMAERQVLQLWDGPGDDADFENSVSRFVELAGQPVVTTVSR